MSFFNRFSYGKNKRDLRPENLPRNRFALFFEMLKINAGKLVAVNLLFAVFVVPAVLWTYVNLVSIQYGYTSGQFQEISETPEAEGETSDATVTTDEILQNFSDWIANGYMNEYMLVLVPLFMLIGLATPSLTYITRNWARDEHTWLGADFWRMIKENWKRALLVGFINGAVLFFTVVGSYLYTQFYTSAPTFAVYAAQGFLWLIAFLVLMMNVYIWPLMVTYDLTLTELFKNSFVLALGKLPKTLFVILCGLLPLLLVYVNVFWALYYLVIGFALQSFLAGSVVNSVFDQIINPKIEGVEIGKGMYTPDPDDDDEDDDETDENGRPIQKPYKPKKKDPAKS